jgi:hypothetical protein
LLRFLSIDVVECVGVRCRVDLSGAAPRPARPHDGLGRSRDRLVAILGVDQELATELFARLRERPIDDERFAVAHSDGDRRQRQV